MILRNAATVVHRLLSDGADLVLHGHKHWEDTTRVSAPPEERSMAIVAAGSAGRPTGDRLRFNFVIIKRSHIATVSHFEAIEGSKFAQAGKPISLGLYGTARQRKRERLIEAQHDFLHWRSRRADHRCEIDYASGNATLRRTLIDVCHRSGAHDFIPLSVRSELKSSAPSYSVSSIAGPCDFKLVENRTDQGFQTGVKIAGHARDGYCGSFAVSSLVPSAIKMTYEAKLRAMQSQMTIPGAVGAAIERESEYEYYDVRHGDVVAEMLSLTLCLPPELETDIVLNSLRVTAYDYSLFPTKRLSLTAANLEDREESNHAAEHLVQTGPTQFVLYIDRPLPGYRYRLSWKLPREGTE